MSDLENIYKINKYFYMDSNQKIFKYKKCCVVYDCEKDALFNYVNEKNPIYCNDHKLENMINVKKLDVDNTIVYYVINIFLKIIIFLKSI